MIDRILASTGSGNLISRLLGFERVSFDLKAVSLFPDGVHEEEGKGGHWLDTLTNHSSFRSPELSYRTPQRECDAITFLCVLLESVWCRGILVPPERSLKDHILLPWWYIEAVGHMIACLGVTARMKMDDFF